MTWYWLDDLDLVDATKTIRHICCDHLYVRMNKLGSDWLEFIGTLYATFALKTTFLSHFDYLVLPTNEIKNSTIRLVVDMC